MRFLAFLIAVLLAHSAEASITITNLYSVVVRVDDGFGHAFDDFYGHYKIPNSATVSVFDENAYSKTTIDFSVIGGQTILSFDMDHKQLGRGIYNSYADGWSTLAFTANSDEPYELSGYYNVVDVGASGRVYQRASLHDRITSVYQFYGEQISDNTNNEQLILGGTGGDTSNRLEGSLTGTLIAGHSYGIYFSSEIDARSAGSSGATALGNFTLKIGNVPEPSTLLLLGIGAISLLGYRKAKSHS